MVDPGVLGVVIHRIRAQKSTIIYNQGAYENKYDRAESETKTHSSL